MSHIAHAGEDEDGRNRADLPLKRLFASCERQNDNTDCSYSLPYDLIQRIMSLLPSPLLFECRVLSKAAHAYVQFALPRRPFFMYQVSSSSQCFLLPLDALSTPLPCTFTLKVKSFELMFASSNLLCMRRRYPSMLDICVCDVFRRRRVMVPPIVHPHFAPHILRKVLLEDRDVDGLNVIGFHAFDDDHHDGSPHFRIFVANNVFLRVFDSRLNRWSERAHFPTHLCTYFSCTLDNLTDPPTPPHCFIASDGTIILTFARRGRRGGCALFDYDHLAFHGIEGRRPDFPCFDLAGYPASACVGATFNLEIHLPHVEGVTGSNPRQGLVLKGKCEGDHGVHYTPPEVVLGEEASDHRHHYDRRLVHSYCDAYKNTVYALVMEMEESVCIDERVTGRPAASEWEGWQGLSMEEVDERLRQAEERACARAHAQLDCPRKLPVCPSRLMVYTACVDTTDWTMQILNRTDATALLPPAERNNREVGRFLLLKS